MDTDPTNGPADEGPGFPRWLKWGLLGALAILILAAVPNPFFDLAGIAAGITKLPLKSFLIACWIGQTIKMSAFAYAGAASLNWLFS